ncbi:MAG: hypothetical protein IKZ43_07930 [Acidaminococcaceae bacterium]|nr:hypothetical protein [Acidaminococcaceae bacterium]
MIKECDASCWLTSVSLADEPLHVNRKKTGPVSFVGMSKGFVMFLWLMIRLFKTVSEKQKVTRIGNLFTSKTGKEATRTGNLFTSKTGKEATRTGNPFTSKTGKEATRTGNPFTSKTGKKATRTGNPFTSSRCERVERPIC